MAKMTDKQYQQYMDIMKSIIEKHENKIKNSVEVIVSTKIELEKTLIKYENRGV